MPLTDEPVLQVENDTRSRFYWFVAATMIVIAAVVVAAALAAFTSDYFLVSAAIFFALLISLLEATRSARKHAPSVAGLSFGFLIGLTHLEAQLSPLHHWKFLSVNVFIAVFFAILGLIIGSGGEIARAVLWRGRPSTAEPEQPRRRLNGRLAVLLAAALIVLTVVLSADVASLFLGNPIDLYLTLELVFVAILAAVVVTHRRFFAWLTGSIVGYFLATLVVVLFFGTPEISAEFKASFDTALFFAVLGAVIGLLAMAIIRAHELFHENFPAGAGAKVELDANRWFSAALRTIYKFLCKVVRCKRTSRRPAGEKNSVPTA